MPNKRGDLKILACNSGTPFAQKVLDKIVQKEIEELVEEKIAKEFAEIKEENTKKTIFEELKKDYYKVLKNKRKIASDEIFFANSEVKTKIEESIREADVYIFQDIENKNKGYSIDTNLRSLTTAIDAAWRSDARYITAVIPVFPYARQDKQHGREAITAAMVAREIEESHADHVVTMDVHNTAIAGFFRKAKFENLHASKNFIDYIKSNNEFDLDNSVVMCTDLGGAKRIEHYAQELNVNPVFAYKERDMINANQINKLKIVGDVKNKDVFIIDDMVDTAGTLVNAVKKAKESGANNIYTICSLALLNGNAVKNIDKSYKKGLLKRFITTDVVYQKESFKKENPWYHEVSAASYVAKVITCMNRRESISKLLE